MIGKGRCGGLEKMMVERFLMERIRVFRHERCILKRKGIRDVG